VNKFGSADVSLGIVSKSGRFSPKNCGVVDFLRPWFALVDSRRKVMQSNQRLAWTLKDAAARCGVSYWTLYRAACRGDLHVIKGFKRMMVAETELNRFLGMGGEYAPNRKREVAA
jgi:hypothetical protein